MTGLRQVLLGQQGGVSVLFKGRRTFQSEVVPLATGSATSTHEAAEFTSGYHRVEGAKHEPQHKAANEKGQMLAQKVLEWRR